MAEESDLTTVGASEHLGTVPTVPIWLRLLERSIKQNKSDRASSWLQLATVRNDGRPAVRTVVHRAILEPSEVYNYPDRHTAPCLSFITDKRSEKFQQVVANSYAEAAWYFSVTREQWRISGRLTIVSDERTIGFVDAGLDPDKLQKARLTAWHKLSDAARAQFVWPAPGQARIGPDSDFVQGLPLPAESPALGSERPAAAGGAATDSSDPAALQTAYSNFCLMLLTPDSLDHLCLRANPTQRRTKYEQQQQDGDGGEVWTATEVNP